MCGIAGLVTTGAPADEAKVRRMNLALRHRGPDVDRVWTRGRAALGHRRLSIIDLSPEAAQPLLNEDGTVGVVVNGEFYNFVELRQDLVRRGHTFRSLSDSEVLVHLYEEYGVAGISKLDGMFAFGLWDSRTERLVIGRDRAGKKPLFYARLPDGGLAFASELHALLAGFPSIAREPDLEAIDEYLTLQYVPAPHTAFRGIAKLPAAHFAVLERGRELAFERYWSMRRGPELAGTEHDLARELRTILTRAVKKRLVADVPLGAFLSGGIDSSAVVGLMATSGQRVETFSIGFPDSADSELPWARMVAERYGTKHHEQVVGPDVERIVTETVAHHGEPFADSSAVATYCLAEMTRKSVTVALSGDGSDESFAGYTRYSTAQLGHVYDALPAGLKAMYQGGLRAAMNAFAPHVAGYARHLHEGDAVRYPYIMCQFTPEEKLSLYAPRMRAVMTGATARRFAAILKGSARESRLGRLLDLDWNTYLTDDINAKVDIASMSHALEVRCPFLDTEVVEFAARLPRRMLMRLRGKHILRAAVGDLIPRAILRRRKRGFGLPLARWMRRDLAPLVRDVLLDGTARGRGLFQTTEVERLLGALDTDRRAPDRVWTLFVLELWLRRFVDAAAVASAA
jgi:asparagine synthase (glutamine-hydrolysing)